MIQLDNAKKYKMETDFYSIYTTRGQRKINKMQYVNLLNGSKFVFLIYEQSSRIYKTCKSKAILAIKMNLI